MLALQLLLALVLLLICGLPVGLLLTRHLRWSPLEKLCGSVGASFAFVYLAFGLIYYLSPSGADVPRKWLFLVSAVSLGLGVAIRRDIATLARSFRVRRTVAGFGFLLVWTVVLLAMIRNYSGAFWFGDWLEHFQRTLFFVHHFPIDSPIILGYQLPARPPAMNEMAAFFLGQTGDRFEIFQFIFSFLNLLMFLPCCLMMPALVGPRRTFVWPLVALFALNPVVMQNSTYTWTKAFTAFYVILGLWFYLAAWRKKDMLRMTVAFAALSVGLLVHYSAAPYGLFLTIHYLLRLFPKRPRRWLEIASIALVCGVVLATWFGWSIAAFGTRTTFASNSSVVSSERYAGDNVGKMSSNLVDSIVPVVLRDNSLLDNFKFQGLLGNVRDDAFIFYQTNLIFSMGVIGGPLILWLLYRVLRKGSRPASQRSFWLAMIPFCIVVGIASVGERDPLGTAHLTLLPMEVLGLSLLAATFPLRRALLGLVVAGCLIDFSFGIFLHARIEGLENTSQKTIFPSLIVASGKQPNPVPTSDSLSEMAWNNWLLKHQYSQLEDVARSPFADSIFGGTKMQDSLRGDDVFWHGWYARHNGSIEFLGDRAAGESGIGATILVGILAMLAFGLAWLLAQFSTTAAAEKSWRFALVRGAADTSPAGK